MAMLREESNYFSSNSLIFLLGLGWGGYLFHQGHSSCIKVLNWDTLFVSNYIRKRKFLFIEMT